LWQNDTFRAVLLLLIISLLLESFVFNFRFFTSLVSHGTTATLQNGTLGSGIKRNPDGTYTVSSGEKTIEFQNINLKIHDIFIDIRNIDPNPAKQATDVTLYVNDRSSALYYSLPARDIIRGIENTKYLQLYTAGVTKDLKIQINAGAEESFNIGRISLNNIRPFTFSIGRFAAVFGILLLIYIARPKSKFYRVLYRHDSWKQRTAAVVLCGVICFGFFTELELNQDAKTPAAHHLQYIELTDAILDTGHVYLPDLPPAVLRDMQNPYDTALRNQVTQEAGVGYRWDTAYFGGRYYVYFGITPVVLFYLPYKLLTGADFQNNWAVFIFCCISAIAMFGVLSQVIRRWFPKTPFLIYLLLSVIGIAACGALRLIALPYLYEIPCSGALALGLSGIYFWLASIRTGPADPGITQISVWRILLGSVCVALVGGCRPQVLICALLAFPIFWDALAKKRLLFSRQGLWATVALCAPFAVIGAGLMYYNFIRFGSVFDFGSAYNLTVDDMTSRGFVPARIPVGFWMYFFQPAAVSSQFPYFGTTGYSTEFLINNYREPTAAASSTTSCFSPMCWRSNTGSRSKKKNCSPLYSSASFPPSY